MNKLYKAYFQGRIFISRKVGVTAATDGIIDRYNHYFEQNPYDKRTKEGRAWKMGVCHESDARFHVWFRIPDYGELK